MRASKILSQVYLVKREAVGVVRFALHFLRFACCFCVWLFAMAGVSRGATRLSDVELELWNSPAFQKQFAESYLAETEIEPTVTQSEREKMLDVLELISSDKMDSTLSRYGCNNPKSLRSSLISSSIK